MQLRVTSGWVGHAEREEAGTGQPTQLGRAVNDEKLGQKRSLAEDVTVGWNEQLWPKRGPWVWRMTREAAERQPVAEETLSSGGKWALTAGVGGRRGWWPGPSTPVPAGPPDPF